MGLFNFGKKKEKAKESCCCSCSAEEVEAKQAVQKEQAQTGVKVLGSGCAKCNDLERATKAALDQLGLNIEIEHVTDFAEIATYGVMTTPALVVNGKVVSYGKVLKTEEVLPLLEKYL